MSGENISDKVYDLMESYLPRDIPSIQKKYIIYNIALSIMCSTHWLVLDLILKLFIVIKQLLIQFGTG